MQTEKGVAYAKSLLFLTLAFWLALAAYASFLPGFGAASQAEATPTPDRLAEPTLPAAAGPADLGAQKYWLHCMPCHGDRGQGLTVEFRVLYPPEDRNCWASGCHGARPYEQGFSLPPSVPKIIGANALANYATASSLFDFLRAAMPFQAPGSLDEATYWEIMAFLLRENGVHFNPEQLDPVSARTLHLHGENDPGVSVNDPTAAVPSGGEPGSSSTPLIDHTSNIKGGSLQALFYLLAGLVFLATLVLVGRKLRR